MSKSDTERHGTEQEGSSPQYGNKTLSALKQSLQESALQLFAQAMAGGMVGLYRSEGYPVHFIGDALLRCLLHSYESFMQACGGNFIEIVLPEDRPAYHNFIEATTRTGAGRNQATIRVWRSDGTVLWTRQFAQQIAMEDQREVVLLLLVDVTETVSAQQEMEQKAWRFEERTRKLALLTANIPGGVCEVQISPDFTLCYGNEGFYHLIGYTQEQLRQEKNSRLLEIIVTEDRDRVRDAIDAAVRNGNKTLEFEHRFCRRDGTVVWVLVRGSIPYADHKLVLNCVVIDITDRKRIEQDLRINEERFRIALAQTDNTIFDYDIAAKTMIHGDRSADLYGLKQITENVPDSLIQMGVIHADYVDVFLDMYEKVQDGVEHASCVIRARTSSDEYVWRKISMTTVFNNDGKPVRAVGILEDIDAQTRREQELRNRSERDALTNLYNRGATESYITKRLQAQRDGSKTDALIVLDIDTFKAINDQYGHMFGDYVLAECARRISRLFHSQDVIGRIGGDEFIVFMSQLPSGDTAYQCAQQICATFQAPFLYKGGTASVSCSLGIAFCPKHGATFTELYQHADIALYEAKRSGKNRCVQFSPELFDGEWLPYSSTAIDSAN